MNLRANSKMMAHAETVVGLLEKGVELTRKLPAASKIVGLMFMLSDRLVDKIEGVYGLYEVYGRLSKLHSLL